MPERIKDRELMSEKSGITAFKHETRYVNSKFICVDEDYQRVLSHDEVKKIIAELDPNVERMPRVSYRCGKYYVFEGQHTVAMLKELNDQKDLDIECEVNYGMTKRDEAKLFAKQNGYSRRLKVSETMKGNLTGGDEDTQKFKDLVESVGFICDFENAWAGEGRLICFKAAFGIYKQVGGPDRLREILEIIKGAWGMNSDGLRGQLVCGLNIVIRDNPETFDKKRMIEKLSRVSPLQIFRDGRAQVKGGNKRFAVEIARAYNSNLRKGTKLVVKGMQV